MKNFFQFYRKLIAKSLTKFVKDHPEYADKQKILDGTRLLNDLDYEGDDLQGFYNSYTGAEEEMNYTTEPDDLEGIVHDTIVDFLCDVVHIRPEDTEYKEMVNNVIKDKELKEFIENNKSTHEDEEVDE